MDELMLMPEEGQPSVVDATTRAIAALDPYVARMNELRVIYGGIKINGVDDKENIELAKKAVSELTKIRTGSERDKKTIKRPLLDACDIVEGKWSFIETGVKSIEDPIRKQLKEVADEEDRLKREKKQKQEERFILRQQELSSMGVLYADGRFSLNDVSYEMTVVKDTDDSVYENILNQFKDAFEINKKAAEEKEKQAQAVRDKLEQDRKDLEVQQKALQEKQDAIDKQERDRKQAIYDAREKRVIDAGFLVTRAGIIGCEKTYPAHTMTTEDDELFDRFIFELKTVKHQYEIFVGEQKEKANQELIRKENERKQQELEKQKAEEQEKLAAASDKEKWDHFKKQIKELKIAEFTSKAYAGKATAARTKLNEIYKL